MKPIEIEGLVLFVAMIVIALFGIWVGVGLGLLYCDEAKAQGYSHLIFRDGVRAYCEIREAK